MHRTTVVRRICSDCRFCIPNSGATFANRSWGRGRNVSSVIPGPQTVTPSARLGVTASGSENQIDINTNMPNEIFIVTPTSEA